jgi:hypothetical protein
VAGLREGSPRVSASSRGVLTCGAQQAPGFCAQKSSNCWALEPAGGGVSLLGPSAPPVGAAAPPPAFELGVVAPPVPVDAVGVPVVPVEPVAPVEPEAPLDGVAVAVGVGVALLELLLLLLLDELEELDELLAGGGASGDDGMGASAYGLGTSGATG